MPGIRLERKQVLGEKYLAFYQNLSDFLLEYDLDKERKEQYFELQSVLYSNDWRKLKKAITNFNVAAKAFSALNEKGAVS